VLIHHKLELFLEPDETRRLYRAGCEFSASAEILNYPNGLDDITYNNPRDISLLFSIELFLKCLLSVEGKEIPKGRDGHHLRKLFDKISDENKQVIREKYSSLIPAPTNYQLDKYKGTSYYKLKDETDIKEVLTMISSVYMHLRYVYEGHEFAVINAPIILVAVRSRIDSIKPDFQNNGIPKLSI
jgi:HEPN domain-containing protein